MIWTNKRMEKILNKINLDEVLKNNLLNIPGISPPEFIEIGDCILLKVQNEKVKELDMNFIQKFFGDKTGLEASNNHIHISQYIDDSSKSLIEGLKLALCVLDAWKIKLRTDFPEYKFHIILSYDGKESTLRFHKYREDEGFWLIIDDLDGYKDEAILVVEI